MIESLAREAGDLAMTHFGQLSSDQVEAKGPLDLVTVADRAVESMIVDRLRQVFPNDAFFGEEGGVIEGRSGRIWVIDPIDGTMNFVRSGSQWSVSIGLYDKGEPKFGVVFAPLRDVLLSGGGDHAPLLNGRPVAPLGAFDPTRAVCGIGMGGAIPLDERLHMLDFMARQSGSVLRMCNSATMSILEIVSGEVDGYVGLGESLWDVAGVWPALTSIGAVSSLDWKSVPLSSKLRFAIGKPGWLANLSGLGLNADGSRLNLGPSPL